MLAALRQKIISNVKLADGPIPDSDCWHWVGARMSRGYGALHVKGIWLLAHRASYRVFIGPIPEGKLIRHRCHVRECVSPWHLVPGTHQQNREDQLRRRLAPEEPVRH
jgi:hypothetical protein